MHLQTLIPLLRHLVCTVQVGFTVNSA